MKAKPLPSQEELHRLLRYEPDTGKLFWKERSVDLFETDGGYPAEYTAKTWNTRFAGKEASSLDWKGYKKITIHAMSFLAHRVIFKMMTGLEPPEIDHQDHDRSNNIWLNLTAATKTTNGRNRTLSTNNTSGFNGIRWSKECRRWNVRGRVDGKLVHIGYFTSHADAVTARRAFDVANGYHPNHGSGGGQTALDIEDIKQKDRLANRPLRPPHLNISGRVGVFWREDRQKWLASGRANGKKVYLGLFTNIDDAIAAREMYEMVRDHQQPPPEAELFSGGAQNNA